MNWEFFPRMKVKVLNENNMNSIELKPTEKKDHYRLVINGVDMTGEQERSTFRHIIEVIDSKINVGL